MRWIGSFLRRKIWEAGDLTLNISLISRLCLVENNTIKYRANDSIFSESSLYLWTFLLVENQFQMHYMQRPVPFPPFSVCDIEEHRSKRTNMKANIGLRTSLFLEGSLRGQTKDLQKCEPAEIQSLLFRRLNELLYTARLERTPYSDT